MALGIDEVKSGAGDLGSEAFMLAKIVRERALTIAGITAIATVIAVAYAYKAPVTYLATTKLVIQGNSQSKGGLNILAQVAGISLPADGGLSVAQYLPDIIGDDGFLKEIAGRKWSVGSDSLDLPKFWKMLPDTAKPDWAYRFEKAVIERLRRAIKIKKSETGLILLSTEIGDPQLTYQVNNGIVSEIDGFLRNRTRFNAKQTREFIETRLSESEAKLLQSEAAWADFSGRNMGVSSPNLMLTMKRLQRDVATYQEIFLELKKQYEMARIEELKNQPLLEIVSKATIPIDRYKPNRRQIAGVGLFLGLFLGLLAGFLKHWVSSKLNPEHT